MNFILYTCGRHPSDNNSAAVNHWEHYYPAIFGCAEVSDCNTAFSFWLGADAEEGN